MTTTMPAHAAGPAGSPPARRRVPAALVLGYAVAVYLIFVAVLAYSAGFFIGAVVPKGIDSGSRLAWPLAALIDLLLLSLFAVQHTVMARPWFKRRLAAVLPPAAERSTFVLASSGVLALVLWQWRPLGGTVWHLSGAAAGPVLAIYAAGWAVALGSTFLVSHADLSGLRQAVLYARGAPCRPPPFTERGLYRWIRHPLMTGFLIIFWAAPVMTAGHLLFAAASTGYILVGIAFEERDLRRQLGESYRAYAARVPALIPLPRRR